MKVYIDKVGYRTKSRNKYYWRCKIAGVILFSPNNYKSVSGAKRSFQHYVKRARWELSFGPHTWEIVE